MDFMDANRRTQAPHPPYFPDLALSEFFLFEDVKRELSGSFLDDVDDLLATVQGILVRF
jgi:hypothetical protein